MQRHTTGSHVLIIKFVHCILGAIAMRLVHGAPLSAAAADRPPIAEKDFLTVGSMGHAPAIALGIANARTNRHGTSIAFRIFALALCTARRLFVGGSNNHLCL